LFRSPIDVDNSALMGAFFFRDLIVYPVW